MRKCLRCGTEMKENCAIKVEGAGYGIIMSSDENKLFGGRMGKPKVAICPKCGEVSIYVEDVETVSYTHLRAHETDSYLVCRLLLEKKNRW